MATMRCPNCSSEIRKPGSPWAIILGIVAFLSVGCLMLIVVCVAAIVAIGANAPAEFDQPAATIQVEASDEANELVKNVGFSEEL